MIYVSSFRHDEKIKRMLNELMALSKRSKSNLLRWLIFQEYRRQDLNTLAKDGIPSQAEMAEYQQMLDDFLKGVEK